MIWSKNKQENKNKARALLYARHIWQEGPEAESWKGVIRIFIHAAMSRW
jgi:hypothetical protein